MFLFDSQSDSGAIEIELMQLVILSQPLRPHQTKTTFGASEVCVLPLPLGIVGRMQWPL